MAQLTSGPGVYIDEVPSGVHTITGVSTSIAAFVDFFPRGDLNFARRVGDFGEFSRLFGGLHARSEASYAIQQFFKNGGTDAWVVRTASGALAEARVTILDAVGGAATLRIDAINPGQWGNNLRVTVEPVSPTTFNLGVQLVELRNGERVVTQSEVFQDLTRTAGPRSVVTVINDEFTGSKLIRVTAQASVNLPQPVGTMSGALPAAINLTNVANPQLNVTIGTEGTGTAVLRNWGANPGDIVRARARLEAAIRAARPEIQAFSQATVSIVGNRLRVLAGPTGAGATVTFAASGADPMASLLQLTPGTVLNGALSGDLAAAPNLNGQMNVTIGANGPHLLTIAGAADENDVRDQLEAQLRGADPAPEFTGARVAVHSAGAVRTLVIVPGTPAAPAMVFTAQAADPVVNDLGLAAATPATVTLTGNLTGGAPVIAGGSQVNVTIGGTSRTASTAGAVNTYPAIGTALENAIRATVPPNPAFAGASVAYYDNAENRYMVFAGGAPAVVTFAAAPVDATTVNELLLDPANAQANVQAYQLGVPAGGVTAQGVIQPGNDGVPPAALELIGDLNLKTGIYALERVDLFNILCLPRTATKSGPDAMSDAEAFAVNSAARDYCQRRRSFFIVDTPDNISSVDDIQQWMLANSTIRHRNLALYFPRVEVPDPLDSFRLRSFGASGTVAGIYARVDGTRGVWKAPAGIEATLNNVMRLTYPLTDHQTGILNPLAINCLRSFDAGGRLVWGARTLVGTDAPASEWKYVPVRRMALFLEESLFRGTTWVVFEPNDEPLWAKIRLNLNAFMMGLFRQGAFQGSTPDKAFFVKCDAETTTQADRDLGIVNIEVGFAPLKPAEFVVIKIQQIAGDLA
jgi:phage tail sheath protein FI